MENIDVSFTRQCKFLAILEENARKAQAEVVDAHVIASRLNISLNETRQMARCLNAMEVIESDLEGQRCLITCKGLLWLERYSLCSPFHSHFHPALFQHDVFLQ